MKTIKKILTILIVACFYIGNAQVTPASGIINTVKFSNNAIFDATSNSGWLALKNKPLFTDQTIRTDGQLQVGPNGNVLIANYLSGNNAFVGIGTITPTQKLEVNGNIKMQKYSSLIWDNISNTDPKYIGIDMLGGDNLQYPTMRFVNYDNNFTNTNTAGFNFVDNSNNSMLRIFNKKIGINTNDPRAMINLFGGGDFGTDILFETTREPWARKYSISSFSIPYINDANNAFKIFSINDVTGANSFANPPADPNSTEAQKKEIKQQNLNLLKQISRLSISPNGNVGIGTIIPDAKLTVNGDIHAQELRIDLLIPTADYVFEKYYTGYSTLKSDYKMPTLKEVEDYIKVNHHLEHIPSANEIKENGLKVGEMNNLLLQKVEEMTLYIIELNKKIDKQQEEINKLKK
jgi:hypothetical protein